MSSRPRLASLLLFLTWLLLSCGGGGSSGMSAGSTIPAGATATAAGGAAVASTPAGDAGGDAAGGASTSAGGAAGTSTASSGDSSGVGSGGTGVSTADATSVGSVDGMGSIIVNSVRYNVDAAALNLPDGGSLQIGMSVEVTGTIDASKVNGVARQVSSALELRGPVASVDPVGGSFEVMGTRVSLDDATVWGNVTGLADLAPGTPVQVWGLPADPGVLRATRVERTEANAAPVVTGAVQQLDPASRTLVLGGLTVAYGGAGFAGGVDAMTLSNGDIVRVRATAQPSGGLLVATQVERWYPIPKTTGTPVQLEGVITDYAALGAFQVLGSTVDASAATVTGGRASTIGNGVKVEVSGTLVNGVLIATQLKIRHIPGAGSLPSFTLIGSVGNYTSAASFRVRGQSVDASAPGVVFMNGTQADLANGVDVTVLGSQVVNGVLIANQVSFN